MARVLGLCAAATVIVLLVGCSGGNDSVVTPTGVRYVFADNPSSSFHIFEVIGTTVSQLTSLSFDQTQPSVSWDRTKCAFTAMDPGGSRIAVVSLPDGHPTYLTAGPYDLQPAFSPDGKSIAFVRLGSGPGRIWTMLAGGASPRALGPGTGDETEPEFSQDGRAVYYSSNAAGSYDIYRVDLLSGGTQRITMDDSANERHPTLRGAHEELIYASDATGVYHLYWKDATLPDSAPLQITNGPGDDVEPHWPHPEGTKILFTNMYTTTVLKSLEVYPLQSHTPVVELTRDQPQWPSQ